METKKLIMHRENFLLSLPFDLYGRYKIIADIIKNETKDKSAYTLLDVGGNVEAYDFSILQKFLPNEKVFVIDKAKNSYKNYIQSDALQLPFEDNEIDYVVSCDVLEHIPQKFRERFLLEQLKKARKKVILAAPFSSRDSKKAEKELSFLYKTLSRKNHKWLMEHEQYSLPTVSWIEKILKKNNVSFYKIPHNYLPYWRMMTFANFFTEYYANAYETLLSLNKFYNNTIHPYDRREPAYRYIYVISKNRKENISQTHNTNTIDYTEVLQYKIFELISLSTRQLVSENKSLTKTLDHIYNTKAYKLYTHIKNYTLNEK